MFEESRERLLKDRRNGHKDGCGAQLQSLCVNIRDECKIQSGRL